MDYYAIGQRIRKFRKAKSLSQDDLAEIVNISSTHMSHIETGNTKLSLEVLVNIATALEVCTDELIFENTLDRKLVLNDFYNFLESCNEKETKIATDITKSTINSLRKYQ